MYISDTKATSLLLAFTRLTNRAKDPSTLPAWYDKNVRPTFTTTHNASLGLGYTILPPVNASNAPYKWTYLGIYKTSENTTLSTPIKAPVVENNDDIQPEDVEIEVSAWRPIQVFESLREKRGTVPEGRPKVACVVRIEPAAGNDAAVEDWYHYQHLDLLSMLPNYRRSTRYRSLDGSKPRWLAIHEMDTDYVDPYQGAVMMGTELANKVMDTVQVFDAANWALYVEKGDVGDKI